MKRLPWCVVVLVSLSASASLAATFMVVPLNDPTPQAGAGFGMVVAGVGHIDGDGTPDLLVGAPGQGVGADPSQGQAFLFKSERR